MPASRISDTFSDLDTSISNEFHTRQGSHYFAYVATGSIEKKVWLRIAMTSVGFTLEVWRAVQRLFEKAWSTEKFAVYWAELEMQYGEL
jgi:hypothetical protein